jgi:hypothetical protein
MDAASLTSLRYPSALQGRYVPWLAQETRGLQRPQQDHVFFDNATIDHRIHQLAESRKRAIRIKKAVSRSAAIRLSFGFTLTGLARRVTTSGQNNADHCRFYRDRLPRTASKLVIPVFEIWDPSSQGQASDLSMAQMATGMEFPKINGRLVASRPFDWAVQTCGSSVARSDKSPRS